MRLTRISILCAGTVAIVLLGGCTMLCGPSDEESITSVFDSMKEAMAAEDVDAFMAVYSEDFEGENGESKDQVRQFIGMLIDEGVMQDIEMDLTEMQIEVDGTSATVGPVNYSTDMGDMAVEYDLVKEKDGVWRIVGSGQY